MLPHVTWILLPSQISTRKIYHFQRGRPAVTSEKDDVEHRMSPKTVRLLLDQDQSLV
jgi:hypothetical protein